jgi:hypothetical protein
MMWILRTSWNRKAQNKKGESHGTSKLTVSLVGIKVYAKVTLPAPRYVKDREAVAKM